MRKLSAALNVLMVWWWDPFWYQRFHYSQSMQVSLAYLRCCSSPLLLLAKFMAATASFRFPCSDLWPIGFGFRPTEEELITHYLKNKMLGHASLVQYIREIDLYNYEPWELPEQSLFESDNYEWFFFRAHTTKTRRTTVTGCWRTTGDDRPIKARGTNKVIGTRKILVFYQGRSSNAVRTNWVIHEYHLHPIPNQQEQPYVICRLKENAEERDERHKKKGTHKEMNREVNMLQVQPIQPEASENEVNITEFFNSMFAPDEYLDDATSKVCYSEPLPPEAALMDFQPSNGNDASESEFINLSELLLVEDEHCVDDDDDSYNKQELESMVFELLNGGFGSDTDTDTAFGFPNNHISPNWLPEPEYTSTRSTIKKSRRSPLTVKYFQCKDESERLKREIRSKAAAMSQQLQNKTNDEKQIEIVDSTQLTITDSNNGIKRSEAANKATTKKSTRNCFSYILTTKRIHHKSSLPLVYAAKAFLGIVMFLMFAQELRLYGHMR